MSRASRESVFAALFGVLQGAYAWKTVSRRLQNVQDVAAEDFPAAYQVQGNQTTKYQGSVPAAGDWRVNWILYAYNDDPSTAPSVQLNTLVDAALAALAPATGFDKNTLGGLVEYCAVEGDIEIFEGVLGDRAIAIIPIRIVIAGF